MKRLETNDWMVLNSIIYKIYTIKDLSEMRKEFLEQMRLVIDFDSADFYLAGDNEESCLVDSVTYNCEAKRTIQYDQMEYSRGILRGGKSLVYRETDIISDETRMQSEYYKRVYIPNNWHYSLQMVICKDKKFLGLVSFYRSVGKEDFQYDDIFLLEMLRDHMAFRLEKDRMEKGTSGDKLTISDAVTEYHLTKREETILRLLLAGIGNEQICEQLVISINTLKKHVLNIYRKLGIRNRVQMFKMIREKE